ncbi:MAG: hypothetical protein VZR36_08975 [Prevotella sp.]|nr:hypothetical protein [Prevotella sp.]
MKTYDIDEIISDLKEIANECNKVTSGNVSHRIANIEHGILNIADYLENYCPLGWHPASKLPPVETDIVVWCILDDGQFHIGMTSLSEKKWPDALGKYVKQWCYPPEKYKVRP